MSKQSAIIEAAEEIEASARQIIRVCSRHNGHDWDMSDAARADHERLLSLAQRLRAEASGWQPIETAPRDGSWVLLSGGRQSDTYWDDQGDLTWPGAAVCRWCDETESWQMGVVWDGDLRSYYKGPTHWMPLPAPPKVESKE